MERVVKVKHQKTLRRLTLILNQDGNPLMSLEALTTQIHRLFNFAPDAQLEITYTDVDDDVVTMADDVDLLDAVRQGLNPLRLDVSLAATSDGRAATSDERTATSDGRSQGWDAMRNAVRLLTDPTCPIMRFAGRPAVNYVLPYLELVEGLFRVATTQLGLMREGLANQMPCNNTASGSNM